ncbi:hypothetical protein [Sporolactobacillus sp. THM19-2]|uniref:hypothetical protein n=1 Tax=Sporolactobacillus sp. THM19-2 TaxID=2511171 RepID=UPI0010206CBC|nr:hypothetical protein [Sporolactobacillus sp. THM19-2]RYL88551.1 hypothetical protein EWH91_11555 [Sporolactobacillus sp. THM19-2]
MPTITLIGNPAVERAGYLEESGTMAAPVSDPATGRRGSVSVLRRPAFRLILVRGGDRGADQADIRAAEKIIARSKLILLMHDVTVGAVMRIADLAKKHQIKVVIDPVPSMALSEKIRRAIQMLPKAGNNRKRSIGKKWRRRKLKTVK